LSGKKNPDILIFFAAQKFYLEIFISFNKYPAPPNLSMIKRV
jgi:hypothetical protein